MGVKTLYEYFYKLAYGDKGVDKATLVNGCLDVADAEIKANKDAKHGHDNKTLLDTYTQTEANLSDAITKKHTKNSDTDLDATFEATFIKKADNVNALADITSPGANIEDAVTKKHTVRLDWANIVSCKDYDHPDDAITAIASANKTLLVTESEICDTSFTVPANVTVKFERGGKWTINTGITVTINGYVEAGLFEIFTYTGTGVCTLSKNTEIHPEWWGAVADGSTDDYTALSRTITAAAGGRWVKLQSCKTYLINTELSFHTGTEGVKFDGNFSTIKAGGAMTNVVSIGNTTTVRVQLKNLRVDANSVATYGIYMQQVSVQLSLIQNCEAKNAVSHGWYLHGCEVLRFQGLLSEFNGGAGFLIEDCNGCVFDTIRARANTDNGITIQKVDSSGGCQFFNIDSESNSEHGIEVVDTTSPVTIVGGWIEANAKDGILITAKGVVVKDVGISGGDVGNNYYAIRLNSGAAGCTITDNKFVTGAGTVFHAVYDNSGGQTNVTYPNFYRTTGEKLDTKPDGENAHTLMIGGVKSIANTPIGLFTFVLNASQIGCAIQFWAAGLATGICQFSLYEEMVASYSGTLQLVEGTPIIAHAAASGANVTITAVGATVTVYFQHGSATSTDIKWRAVIIGNCGVPTKL